MEIKECIKLEYSIAPIIARQCSYGVEFDVVKAQDLLCKLQAEKVGLKQLLQQVFLPRVVNLGEFNPKKNYTVEVNGVKHSMVIGGIYTKIKFEEYNPNSRQQTVDRLVKELGWTPQEFTDKGNPEFDEEIIESLPFKALEPLKNYYIVTKRISQLEGGRQAWLAKVMPDGRIYGGIMQSGTITARMAHFQPNLAQVPSCDKPWGRECRELFKPSKGRIMIGCDADGLEARTLSGFLVPFDGGVFRDALLKGKKEDKTDIHSLNAIAYCIDKYDSGRDCSKTLFYASIYGAANAKLGLILQQFGVNFRDYVDNFEKELVKLKVWNEKKHAGFSDKYLECLVAGKTARDRYGEASPGLPKLIKNVIEAWKSRGFLKGLDGRKLYPRTEHSVFNTLNQSAGAIIMKKALAIAESLLDNSIMSKGRYEFLLNVHDEWQLEVDNDPRVIEFVSLTLAESIKLAGEYFKFPCPMVGSVKVGNNWAETH